MSKLKELAACVESGNTAAVAGQAGKSPKLVIAAVADWFIGKLDDLNYSPKGFVADC